MYTYKICFVDITNGLVQLRLTDKEFESRDNAEAFLRNAEQYGFGGYQLTILELFES